MPLPLSAQFNKLTILDILIQLAITSIFVYPADLQSQSRLGMVAQG